VDAHFGTLRAGEPVLFQVGRSALAFDEEELLSFMVSLPA
jgi:hypothetical protein